MGYTEVWLSIQVYEICPAKHFARNIAVIPKSNNVARLKQNLEVNDFSMTKEELAEIADLDMGLRFNDPGFYLSKPLRIFD